MTGRTESPDRLRRSSRTGSDGDPGGPARRPGRADPGLLRQRLSVLFLAGLLLWFSPLVLRLEGAGRWLGIPLLYLYLFGAWALLIVLAALVVGQDRD